MKPKILYIVTQGDWGGAQRYVFDLATHLSPKFDVTVAVGEPNGKRELQRRLKESGIKNQELGTIEVVQLKHLVRRISPWHDYRALFELASLYKKNKPNIVHLNSSKAGIIGSLAKSLISDFRFQISIIYTVHGWIFNEPLGTVRKKLYQLLEKWTSHSKDFFIFLSEIERSQGIDLLGIPMTKGGVIPHGVKLPPLLPKEAARTELNKKLPSGSTPGAIWVGAVANYYATKGLDVLIEAVRLKKKELNNITVLLIGEGPERERLTKKIIAADLQTTIFLTGTIPDAARYLNAFNLFALPSRKEGLPYALLEAIAAGLPCLATTVGGIPELARRHHNIHLVPPQNPDALGEVLVQLLTPQPQNSAPDSQADTLNEELTTTIKVYEELMKHRP